MKRDENMAREYVKKDNMLSKEIRYKKTEKGMMLQNENLWHQEPFFRCAK